MGGNAFPDTQPVTLAEYLELALSLRMRLETMGCEKVTEVGSTGKVETMGDIDLAVEHQQGRDYLAAWFVNRYGKQSVKRSGSRQVTVRYPNGSKHFQLDLFVGPPGSIDWLWWSHYSPGTASPIKGVVRNLLLNTITRELCDSRGDERTRLLIDWDVGAYQTLQVYDVGDDSVTPAWRTLHKNFVTSDPNVLVNRLFGKEYSAKDVVYFDDVVRALKATSLRAPEILKCFIDEVKELSSTRPQLFGDVDATLAYVKKTCLP